MTDDLSVWRSLTERLRVDLFCGLFMREADEGITVSAKT
jgi:hypothetical protein